MTDQVSVERRSEIMARVRGKDTKPEILVRQAAHRLGLRFRLHGKELPGKPDLVLRKWRTVVFVNGCFWHRHPGCRRAATPAANRDYWRTKFETNVRRDRRNQSLLEAKGWRVVVIWECECRTDQAAAAVVRAHFAAN